MRLNYKKYSESGAPLLVLHGLFGSLGNWGWHSKELSRHYSVIGVDLRNHGNSPHDAELSYPAMASDVLQLIENLGFASVAIIGHSMGGKVAMELALQHHRIVNRLIIVDIAPVAYPDDTQTHQRAIAGMQALNLVGLKTRDEAEELLVDYIEEEATRKFILTNLARDEGGGFRWRLNLEAVEKNYGKLRMKPTGKTPYRKPTLFIKGALSTYISSEDEEEILRLFPEAKLKTIMQAGHWLHVDKPKVFQKIALNFLAGKE